MNKKTITAEIKLHDQDGLHASLEEIGSLYGTLRRKLFNTLTHAETVDSELKNKLKTQWSAKHKIHNRMFNALWTDAKGMLDSIKALDKENKKDLKAKIKKYNKKISTNKKQLKRGWKKTKEQKLKPHQRKQLIHNLHQFCGVVNRLKHKLEKQSDPKMMVGSRDFYKKQWTVEEYQDKEGHSDWLAQWRRKRNCNFTFIGSSDETAGNQMCQYMPEEKQLRITLPYCLAGKHLTIPATFSSDDKTNEQYYSYFHQAVKEGRALSYRFLQRENGCWYCIASFSLISDPSAWYGAIGVDMNYNLIATTEIDRHGNLVGFKNYILDSENMSSNQIDNEISKAVSDIANRARKAHKCVVMESLDLRRCKTDGSAFVNRKVSLIQYGILEKKLDVKCVKENVHFRTPVNPAFTSIIGRWKYMKFYGISIHNSAALVIARRGCGYKDKVPNQICRILHRGEADGFDMIRSVRHHWAHWSFVNKNLESCLEKSNSIIGGDPRVNACDVNNLSSRFNPSEYVVHHLVTNEAPV